MATGQGYANIYSRQDVTFIVVRSLVEGCDQEPDGVWHGLTTEEFELSPAALAGNSSPAVLGRVLREALGLSRIGVPAPAAWANGIGSDKAQRDTLLASAFGLPSLGRLYSGMRVCLADWTRGELILIPTRRSYGGRFAGFEPPWNAEHADVVVPFASSDADLGEAVTLCLERCL
jgi:hypothetical protein